MTRTPYHIHVLYDRCRRGPLDAATTADGYCCLTSHRPPRLGRAAAYVRVRGARVIRKNPKE